MTALLSTLKTFGLGMLFGGAAFVWVLVAVMNQQN